jgi:hypothetical protein
MRWLSHHILVRKRLCFAPSGTKNDHLTKTGSGQTQGKLTQREAFSFLAGGKELWHEAASRSPAVIDCTLTY